MRLVSWSIPNLRERPPLGPPDVPDPARVEGQALLDQDGASVQVQGVLLEADDLVPAHHGLGGELDHRVPVGECPADQDEQVVELVEVQEDPVSRSAFGRVTSPRPTGLVWMWPSTAAIFMIVESVL